MGQPYPNELWHYGILGQKWGVRRFQNPDGSYTDAGKKRYASSIKKSVRTIAPMKSNASDVKNEIKNDLLQNGYKSIKNVNEVIKSLDNYRKAVSAHKDFYDSEECYEASAKAYQDAIEYFKQNDPEYLEDIIRRDNGRDDDLIAYHDFRKTFEGFEDEAWQEAEEKYYSKPENKMAKAVEDEAYSKYMSECKKAAADLIGTYGDKRLPDYGSGNPYKNVEALVTDAVGDFASAALKRKNWVS